MALSDLQYSYRGLVFGEGCDVMVNNAEGFEGYEVRSADSDQPRGDGGLRGLDYVAPRSLSFELSIFEPDGNTYGSLYEELWARVRSTFRPSRDTDYPLNFKRPGQPERMIMCRPVQLIRSESYRAFNRVGSPPVALRAVDPRIYSATRKSGNVPIYAATGGTVDFALDYTVDWDAGTRTELVVENAGDANAYPLVRFYGPGSGTCTGVRLTNSTTGQVLDISATVTAGQILTADMEAAVTGANRLVISLDGSSRYGDWELPRQAFYLAPGSNTLRFEVTGTSTDVVCNLQWRDTWLG
ncbi:hypothetical protein ACFQH9_02160 [Pseudonocardia lutea]|uniref:Tail protein n=1 Tax=Pseudonocardia lutea TaxID=2172015 RepID=A0ABW1I349_9PSEU